jgi:2,3-bisphosphoglycerate-independent phosphoglycerate mutase
MRAKEIADKAIERIDAGDDFLVINFANADMVGHTANRPAIITAVETVDRELRRIVEAALARGGAAIVTADHGNAEMNIDPVSGERHTSHTLNLVPCVVVLDKMASGEHLYIKTSTPGTLADIAPTVLSLMGLPKPDFITGRSLI